MKKIFTLMACAIVTMGAAAQVQFGVKLGDNLSTFWGSDAPHRILNFWQGGFVLEYKFTNQFAVAPEVVFSMQGTKYKETFYNKDWKATANVNYVNIPVMFKYYVTDNISIDLGPQVGFNVYNRFHFTKPYSSDAVDLKDYAKKVDFGVGLGLTYNFDENIFIQARYTMGFTKIYKDGIKANVDIEVFDPTSVIDGTAFSGIIGDEITTSLKNAKNSNLQLSVGYKF